MNRGKGTGPSRSRTRRKVVEVALLFERAGGAPSPSERGSFGRARIEAWFASRGWEPWPFQRDAWDAYAAGKSGLIQVATGAGKTFAAYLGPLAALMDEARGESDGARARGISGLRLLYITPLRAVTRDIEKALKEPVGDLCPSILVESRTGDTKASVRAKQKDRLPNVLVTTPESLTLLLTRENSAEMFTGLRAIIVDEWHELIAGKRGTQTELALARLRRFAPGVRTWAMSATLPNMDEAARAVVGTGEEPTIVRGEMERAVVVDAVVPSGGSDKTRLPWAGHLGLSMLPEVVKELDPERTPTILFTNTRSQAERWFHALAVVKPEWVPLIALHHGSIEREERERVEGGLKSGEVRLVVATSSLDLGVDFSPVERVFQIGSPKGVARLVQRAGRSSHRPKAACRVTCVPTHALELIEIAAVKRCIAAGEVEERRGVRQPLDVLAQHLVTCALGGGFVVDELYDEVRTAWAYRDLTRQEFDWALALVEHGGSTLSAYPDYHRVKLVEGRYRVPEKRLAQLHRLNVGTITADSTVDVRFVGGRSLGRIEENFIGALRENEKFVFAGKVVRFVGLADMVAYVRPATGKSNHTPSWYGTRLPISESLAQSIRETLERCRDGHYGTPELDAAREIVETQVRHSLVPSAHETLIELCKTREGWHLFMFPFEGRLVHGGLAALLALRLSRVQKATFSIAVSDYGIEILCADEFPFRQCLTPTLFSRERLLEDALESVNVSALAKLQFREVARVANLVFQTYPGTAKNARQLQASTSLIFDVLTQFDPENLLLHQARREVLERQYEESRLAKTLARMERGPLRIVETARPTPLSFPIVVERLAANSVSSETLADRVRKMREAWAEPQGEVRSTDGNEIEVNPRNPSRSPASRKRGENRAGV